MKLARPHTLRLLIRKLLVCSCTHSKYMHICHPAAGGCLLCGCESFDLLFYKRGAA